MSKVANCPTCGNEYDSKTEPLLYKRAVKPGKTSGSEQIRDLKGRLDLAEDMAARRLARMNELETERLWLLKVAKRAYRKHHLDDDSIGWDELGKELCDALCNSMGDDGFQEWREARQ